MTYQEPLPTHVPESGYPLEDMPLCGTVPPARAYHLDRRAYALIGDPDANMISLTALVVPRSHRRNGWGSRLMLALFAAYPDRTWSIPQIVPEGLAPAFFARCGWGLLDTNQLEMALDLSAGGASD